MTARADVELQPPILLSERGEGAPESMIVTGIASAAPVLRYEDGDDMVGDGARQDTADQLIGVPLCSPEDHQRWADAQARGESYDVTPLGTVIESDRSPEGAARFAAAVHGRQATVRVRSGEWPAVSVGYVARYRTRPDGSREQVGRVVNHLALVPRGRDPMARIRADGEDPMPIDLNAIRDMLSPDVVSDPMVRALLLGLLGEGAVAPAPAMIESDAAMPAEVDMQDMQAKIDAATARADAAEAKLSAIEARERKARAAVLSAALTERAIKVDGYDLVRADASDIAAAERALLDHALSKPRADHWGAPVPAPADKANTSPSYRF